MTMTATIEGKVVKVGDWVCFKSDFEQSGQIKEIRRNRHSFNNSVELVLFNENGFGGDYLRYSKTTIVDASDCWL